MTKGDIAKQNFLSGLNCAQAVALAFLEELKLSETEIKKLSIGFGGGLARQRLTCGAVSGMALVLSFVLSNGNDKLGIYKIIQCACDEFKSELGSLVCDDLLKGVETKKGLIAEERTAEYYKKRPCADICKIAGDITEKYLKNSKTL